MLVVTGFLVVLAIIRVTAVQRPWRLTDRDGLKLCLCARYCYNSWYVSFDLGISFDCCDLRSSGAEHPGSAGVSGNDGRGQSCVDHPVSRRNCVL
jgi:hypothetical protein